MREVGRHQEWHAEEHLLAQCDGFDWDDGNAPKVRARHLVEPGECEQVFFGMPLLVSADWRGGWASRAPTPPPS